MARRLPARLRRGRHKSPHEKEMEELKRRRADKPKPREAVDPHLRAAVGGLKMAYSYMKGAQMSIRMQRKKLQATQREIARTGQIGDLTAQASAQLKLTQQRIDMQKNVDSRDYWQTRTDSARAQVLEMRARGLR